MSNARRTFLATEWREAVAQDIGVKNAYPLAMEVTEATLLVNAADATTEATRRQTMRSVLRHRYEVVLPLDDDTITLDLGDVVQITYDRYGLDAGALFRIIGLEPDAENERLTVQVWGPADPVCRMRVAAALSGSGSITIDVTASGGVLGTAALAGTGTVA